ncbi:SANT/Myb domain [Macleaya cordata]|uniref:SANT/Myb domain n=1 Tax=Macleaya cordata TaxID=56857 RepID=A0A200QKF8_MACCD|nr:SANT/Myb domain [Macleaya cordata]
MVGCGGWEVPEQGWRKGPWTADEDQLLTDYVSLHGEGRWSSVARSSGLNRNGKSCRLRWVNYLRPGLKKSHLTPQEESLIIELQALWGNKWSMIARCLPGRTDNEIKNYWRTHLKSKEKSSSYERKSRIQTLKQQLKDQQQQDQQQQEQQQQDGLEETVFMYPTSSGDQCHEPLVFDRQDGTSSSLLGEEEEENLWGGLWNLNDIHLNFDHTCGMQNQTASCGDDPCM